MACTSVSFVCGRLTGRCGLPGKCGYRAVEDQLRPRGGKEALQRVGTDDGLIAAGRDHA